MARITGVISKLDKMMSGDSQATWKNDKGMTYYKFIIKVGDTEGNILSSKQVPSWKIGSKVDVEVNTNDKGTSFKDLKFVNDTEDKPKTSLRYYSPEGVRESCMGIAQRIARMAYEGSIKQDSSKAETKPESINNIQEFAKAFYAWIITDGLGRDQCGIRWYALEEATSLMEFKTLNIKTKTDIIGIAEILLNQVKGVNESSSSEIL